MKNNQEITKKVRVQVLFESGVKKPTRISKMTHIPLRSCERYVSNLKKGISLDRKPGSGGRNKLPPSKVKKVIIKSKEQKKPIQIDKIAKQTSVSKASVRRILNKEGIIYKRLKGRYLNLAQKQRVSFCQEMLKMNQIDQFIFIDETSFWLNKCRPYYGQYGDTVEKQCDLKFSQSKLYSTKLHVWGGISSRGTISLEIFTENMTKEIYKEILKKKRKQMEQLYPHGYRIIEDNDSKHKSKIVKQYIDKYIFSNSFLPDINPIELIWGLFKSKSVKILLKQQMK